MSVQCDLKFTIQLNLINVRRLLDILLNIFLYDTLTAIIILPKVMSVNLSMTFDRPIICKTINLIDTSDNSALIMWWVFYLVGSSMNGRLNVWTMTWPYAGWYYISNKIF
jgi:hypothetical protein